MVELLPEPSRPTPHVSSAPGAPGSSGVAPIIVTSPAGSDASVWGSASSGALGCATASEPWCEPGEGER